MIFYVNIYYTITMIWFLFVIFYLHYSKLSVGTCVAGANIMKEMKPIVVAAIEIGNSSSCYTFSFKSNPLEVNSNCEWTHNIFFTESSNCCIIRCKQEIPSIWLRGRGTVCKTSNRGWRSRMVFLQTLYVDITGWKGKYSFPSNY